MKLNPGRWRTAPFQDVLENAGYNAVEARVFPIACADEDGCKDSGQCPANNIASIMGSDVEARESDECGGGKEAKPNSPHAVQMERRRDGESRCRMVWRERIVGASLDKEMSYAAVIRPHPLDEEQNKLIESEAQNKRETCCDKDVANAQPVDSGPP